MGLIENYYRIGQPTADVRIVLVEHGGHRSPIYTMSLSHEARILKSSSELEYNRIAPLRFLTRFTNNQFRDSLSNRL